MAGKYVARVLSSSTTTLLRKTPSFLRPIAALPNTGISPTAVMVRGLSSSEFKLGGLDFASDGKHWLIWVKEPQGNPSREEIIDSYVNILAHVLGSEEEARMKIYSVSTRHYYAIGALIDEEICSKLRELPQVLSVNEDTYMDMKKKDYGEREIRASSKSNGRYIYCVARVLSSSTATLLRKTPSVLRPIAALPNTGISPTAEMRLLIAMSTFLLMFLEARKRPE